MLLRVQMFAQNFNFLTVLINHILKHLKNEGKNDTEEGGSKPDAKVEDCKPNADATGSGSGTKKQKREKRAKGNCERRYSGAATAAEQKQMKHVCGIFIHNVLIRSVGTVRRIMVGNPRVHKSSTNCN